MSPSWRFVGVVAHLQLDQVAAPGEAAGQPQVAAKAGLAIGPEEAVEAQDEGPARRAQARERGVGPRRPLGDGGGRDGAHLARLDQRPDAEAQRRCRSGVEILGLQVADAGCRGRHRKRESEHHQRGQRQQAAHGRRTVTEVRAIGRRFGNVGAMSEDLEPRQAAELLAGGTTQLVDVREPYEHEAGRIAGDVHIELDRLAEEADRLDRERPVVFYCRSGPLGAGGPGLRGSGLHRLQPGRRARGLGEERPADRARRRAGLAASSRLGRLRADRYRAASSCAANGPRPVRHAAPQRAPSAERLVGGQPGPEAVGHAGGEAVAAAVRVHRAGREAARRPSGPRARPRSRSSRPRPRPCGAPAAATARAARPRSARPGRARSTPARPAPRAASASDSSARVVATSVPGPAGVAHRARVAGGEVDGVGVGELVPGQRVVAPRPEALADHRDRALGRRVEVHEAAALRLRPPDRAHPHAELGQARLGPVSHFVVAQRREERRLPGQLGQLDRRHGAAAAGLLNTDSAWTISPAAGSRSTTANSIHSTCPTTATPHGAAVWHPKPQGRP